jgi:hypothetical protein
MSRLVKIHLLIHTLHVLQALDPGPCPASLAISSPWSFRAATQQLLATLLTLRLPGCSQMQQRYSSQMGQASSGQIGQCGGLIPGGVDDLLWWAQAGADSWVLDHLVGVVVELSSMCEQEEQMGAAAAAAGGGLVMEVIRKVGHVTYMQSSSTLAGCRQKAETLRPGCMVAHACNAVLTYVWLGTGAGAAHSFRSSIASALLADAFHAIFSVLSQHTINASTD